MRTCVGCRQPHLRDELVRLVRDADGVVVVDDRGAKPGRGAYVCGAAECVERGLRRERLAHAFRQPCRVTPELGAAVRAAASLRDATAQAR